MADRLPAGPYKDILLADGAIAPWYMLPFDKHGRCEAPLTADHALKDLRSGNYTDLVIFSHGWNNDWNAAVSHYSHFLDNYAQSRQADWSYDRQFRPMLIGIIWPSAVLVMPWEEGPDFAAAIGGVDEIWQERREIQEIADSIHEDQRDKFYSLAQRESDLTDEESLELARILLPMYATDDPEIPSAEAEMTAEELVALWRDVERQAGRKSPTGDFGFADDVVSEPNVAGILDAINPRNIIRAVTVLMMKDRAGTVGAHGVGEVLRGALSADARLRVHLVGHSYGCKVVLSALCFRQPPRNVKSVLLLQPAISALCFAKSVPGRDGPGGYRSALAWVDQPILTTFSKHDKPLTSYFHRAVRRRDDLGELTIAGAADNKFRALGGFGPAGCEDDCQVIPMKIPNAKYNLDSGAPQIWALNADEHIAGHGDISNIATWWALFNQVNS